MKFNVRVSVANQARVFNVAVDSNRTKQEVLMSVIDISKRFTPKYCEVAVGFGCKAHRGKAISLLDLTVELRNLHFYYYVEKEVKEEKFIPLETFYKAPFIPDYNPFLGATFLHNVDENIMPNSEQGLKDLFGHNIYLAKSGYWYCWIKLDYRRLKDGKFQIGITETETKTIKVKKEYE